MSAYEHEITQFLLDSLKVLPAQTPRAQQILLAQSDVSRLLRGDFTPDTIQRSVEILAKEPGKRGGDPSC